MDVVHQRRPAPQTQPLRVLPSERVVVAAPMSFTGSAQRIWKITAGAPDLLKFLVLGPIAVCLIALVWMLVACWYAMFGIILVIPFRLLRRGQRRQHMTQLQHREVLDAVNRRR